MPWNIFAGTLFWSCWYFTVGFPQESSRAGYAYLMYMLFELYFASFAQFVAAFSPNPQTASILFSTFFSFIIIFNGVVVPIQQVRPTALFSWNPLLIVARPVTLFLEELDGCCDTFHLLDCWTHFERSRRSSCKLRAGAIQLFNSSCGRGLFELSQRVHDDGIRICSSC
jgi:hypothetical protein